MYYCLKTSLETVAVTKGGKRERPVQGRGTARLPFPFAYKKDSPFWGRGRASPLFKAATSRWKFVLLDNFLDLFIVVEDKYKDTYNSFVISSIAYFILPLTMKVTSTPKPPTGSPRVQLGGSGGLVPGGPKKPKKKSMPRTKNPSLRRKATTPTLRRQLFRTQAQAQAQSPSEDLEMDLRKYRLHQTTTMPRQGTLGNNSGITGTTDFNGDRHYRYCNLDAQLRKEESHNHHQIHDSGTEYIPGHQNSGSAPPWIRRCRCSGEPSPATLPSANRNQTATDMLLSRTILDLNQNFPMVNSTTRGAGIVQPRQLLQPRPQHDLNRLLTRVLLLTLLSSRSTFASSSVSEKTFYPWNPETVLPQPQPLGPRVRSEVEPPARGYEDEPIQGSTFLRRTKRKSKNSPFYFSNQKENDEDHLPHSILGGLFPLSSWWSSNHGPVDSYRHSWDYPLAKETLAEFSHILERLSETIGHVDSFLGNLNKYQKGQKSQANRNRRRGFNGDSPRKRTKHTYKSSKKNKRYASDRDSFHRRSGDTSSPSGRTGKTASRTRTRP